MWMRARRLALVLAVLALAAPALRAQVIDPNGMGTSEDQEMRALRNAAGAYSKGMDAKRKADAATDPAKKVKLYTRAKKELVKALGYGDYRDAPLALCQIYLALGEDIPAQDLCVRAWVLDRKSKEAEASYNQMRQRLKARETAAPPP